MKSQDNDGLPLKRKDKWCKRTTKRSKKKNDSIPLAEFEPSCTCLSFASNHDEGWTALLLELVKANLLWWLGLMHALHTMICQIEPPGRIQGSPSNVDSRSDRQWQWNDPAPDVTISPSHFFTIIENLSHPWLWKPFPPDRTTSLVGLRAHVVEQGDAGSDL